MTSILRQLQLKCLEIFDIVDDICKKHNIQYSLCGGSVVGAHLYKGFLPWDDDIDLMMTRDNYNKFLNIAKKSLPKGFSIINFHNHDNPSTLQICFTKIVNESTTLVQTNGKIMGVFIDIDVYDKVPKGPLKEIDLFLCKRILTIDNGKIDKKGLKNKLRNFALDTVLSDRRKFLIFFEHVAEFLGNISSQYTYRELFGAYHYYNMIPYKAAIFENYSSIEFEGRTVMIVRDYMDYLQTRYNRTDFYEPLEKQVPPHLLFVDFNIPYRKYLEKKKKY